MMATPYGWVAVSLCITEGECFLLPGEAFQNLQLLFTENHQSLALFEHSYQRQHGR